MNPVHTVWGRGFAKAESTAAPQQDESYRISGRQATNRTRFPRAGRLFYHGGMEAEGRTFWEGRARAGTRFTAPGPDDSFFRRVGRESRLLELGCGYGRILGDLEHRGYQRLTGIDYSTAMLRQASGNGFDVRLAAASASALPFADDSFDVVLAVALFTCIPDLRQQRLTADEIFRVLRPGGLLWASLFLLNRDSRNRERYHRQAEPGSAGWGLFRLEPGGLLRHHGLGHLRRLFRRFRWLASDVKRFKTMGGHSSRGLTLLGQKGEG